MANTETTQANSTQETINISETLPKAPAPIPMPRDEGELKLVKKVAQAFQTVIEGMESRADARFYVVIERTWGSAETIECATQEALRECVRKLFVEISELRQNRRNADIRICVFHGVRYHLQKWPFSALVHGKDVIPLDPLDDLQPVIDQSGSLLDPPSPADLGARRAVRPQPPAVDGRPAPGPAEASSATEPSTNDESVEDEEELPPDQNPQIVE